MNINAPAGVNVGTGITATWAGPINGTGTLTKLGDGGLVFTNNASTYTGPVVVNAGLLQLDGIMPGSTIGVAAGAIFRGTGSTSAIVTVNTGGAIAPGGSVGTLGIGDFNLFGRFDAEIDLDNGLAPTADLLNVAGGVSIVGGELALNVFDQPGIYPGGVYMIVANDGIDPVSGTFASITGGPGGFSVTVDYAFAGTDSLGRIGTGNDIAVRIIPEPSALALAAVGLLLARRRA
jgi:autotransporter-associated beta strand protein